MLNECRLNAAELTEKKALMKDASTDPDYYPELHDRETVVVQLGRPLRPWYDTGLVDVGMVKPTTVEV